MKTTATKYTPGPWFLNMPETSNGQTDRDIMGADGRRLGSFYHRADQPTRGEADARLIASAPELLEALAGLLDTPDLNCDELDPITVKAIEVSRAALARAPYHS